MAAVIEPAAPVISTVAGLPPPDMTLPALATMKNREKYRQRPEEETEEAQWYSPEEPDVLVEPESVRLKSIHSKQSSAIVFTNKSAYPVRCLWIDFEGNEVVYSVLEPKATKRYHTYVTHPWIVREVQSCTRMLLSGRPAVVGVGAEQTVEVQAPPELKWMLDTHSCFPEQFKKEVKTLLLAHKKLEPFTVHGPANSNTLTARSCFASPTKRSALSSMNNPFSPTSYSTALCKPVSCPVSPRGSLVSRQQGMCSSSTAAAVALLQPLSPSKRLNVGAALPPAGAGSYSSNSNNNTCSGCSLPPLPPLPPMAPAFDTSATSTTSISISSEAAHFTATLTVTSPKRAVMSSHVSIEVLTAPAGLNSGGKTTVNIGVGENSAASAGRASCVSKKGGFLSTLRSMLHPKHSSSKAIIAPTPAAHQGTTTFKLEVQTQQQKQVGAMVADAEDDCCCWPPVDTHLGHLPSHLLVYIAELAHPIAWQTLSQPPKGRPDIKPTIMACAPLTPEQEAEQQQQQQQEQEAHNAAAQHPLDLVQ